MSEKSRAVKSMLESTESYCLVGSGPSVKRPVYMRESRKSHREVFHKAQGERTSDSPRPKAMQKKRRSSLSSDKKAQRRRESISRLYLQGKPYRPDVEAGGEAPCKSGGRSLAMWRMLACEWPIGMTARHQATASRYETQGNTRKTDRAAV